MLICRQNEVNVKEIKCPFTMMGKYESMFPTFDFLAHQISGIVRLPIEMERTFSLATILTNLRRSWLQ
jgi:hypothetical protein